MSDGSTPLINALDDLDEAALIRTIIDAVPDPIFCKDLQARFVLTNRANALMFGYKLGEELGKTVFEIAGLREHAATYQADDLMVLRTGQPVVNHEEPYTRPDGTKGWFLTSKYPVLD